MTPVSLKLETLLTANPLPTEPLCSAHPHRNGKFLASIYKSLCHSHSSSLLCAFIVHTQQKHIFSQIRIHKLPFLYFCIYFFVLFGLTFNVPVNSYGHVEIVSSPNHTFFSWASLTKRLTSILCTYFCLQLTTSLLESVEGGE